MRSRRHQGDLLNRHWRPGTNDSAQMKTELLDVDTGIPRRRILIVDDHPIFREGLTQSINREQDLTVCGEAEDAAQAMGLIAKLTLDLVIVDITLPGKSG